MLEGILRLPDDILSWIEEAAGAPVSGADRIPAGASREGWYIDVGEGASRAELFLRYSPVPMPDRSAFHHLSTEAAVMRALGPTGVAVPTILAVHPEREAVLSVRVPGDTWFYRIRDREEQVRVAQDFIRSLAAQHRLDPAGLGLPELGPVRTRREHALERIAGIRWRGTAPDGTIDPLLRLSCEWLERHVPVDDGPPVLVQGDTGPGNFLYQDGRVTAVVDWELAHWGDPMDDIAWLSLRAVQDTFTHLPDRLAEYTVLSGHEIDERRVWYYRLFAEATMATLYPNEGPTPRVAEERDGGPVNRDIGNGLIYRQLHRRLWLEALSRVMDIDLGQAQLPDAAERKEWHAHYGEVLGSLRTIVPRITDPLASQWTKGVVRMIKYLEELDLFGRQCELLELDDIADALGRRPDSVRSGRTELADANRAGRVSDERYVRYLAAKVARDDHLMRAASGALHERTWPPLR